MTGFGELGWGPPARNLTGSLGALRMAVPDPVTEHPRATEPGCSRPFQLLRAHRKRLLL